MTLQFAEPHCVIDVIHFIGISRRLLIRLIKLYFRCSNVNSIYNHLSERPDLVKVLTDKCKPGKKKFSEVVKGRLFEFKDEEHKFIHPDWKGTDAFP